MPISVHIAYINQIAELLGVVAASSSNSEYPVSNLYDSNYAKTWRSTAAGASAQTLTVDLGAATQIKAVGLMNVNLRSTSTVTIAGHTADSWGTPDFGPETIVATGLGTERYNLFHPLSSAQTFRYWRVSMTDNGNPDGFISVGEWFLGSHVVLSDAYSNANTKVRSRNSVEHRSSAMQGFVYARPPHWEFQLNWGNTVEDLRDELRALDQSVNGNETPFIFVMDATSPSESYYVRMQNGSFSENRIHFDRYNIGMNLIEETRGLSTPTP